VSWCIFQPTFYGLHGAFTLINFSIKTK
jgi:hypothetical protein